MATFRPSAKPKPIKISKFLGINTSVGETEIQIGEAVYMRNFRITKNYKARKRDGHNTIIDFGNTKPVYGRWYGRVGAKTVLITCNDGKAWEYSFATETKTQIGTLTEAKTSIFYFNGKVYFLNGTEYKEYDGTTFQDVEGYAPIIAIETPPAGGGTDFEEINLLTGWKWQYFVGDNTATAYQLRETMLDADLLIITVNGATLVEGVGFTVNRTTGIVTFGVAPINEADVRIKYKKTNAGNMALITGHKFATKFGPSNDTSLFIFGNTAEKNIYRVSGTLKADYFPALSFYEVSDDEYAITDLRPQYDRLIIVKEDRTHYTFAEINPSYAQNTGLNKYVYPSFDLNETVGNVAMGQTQLIENNPVTFKSNSVWLWSNTSVEDERNAKIISDRVKEMLLEEDLSTAITYDYQKEKELWINIGDLVYVWNYGNDTWYIHDSIEATWFLEIEGSLYFGTAGKVEVFGTYTLGGVTYKGQNDNGVAVHAILELGFTDFGVNNLTKNTRKVWITIQPENRTSVIVNFETDEDFLDDSNEQEVIYAFLDFNDVDFNFFPFTANPNPQGERLKVRAKKYQYIKFIFENNRLNQGLTILNFEVQADTAGEVK